MVTGTPFFKYLTVYGIDGVTPKSVTLPVALPQEEGLVGVMPEITGDGFIVTVMSLLKLSQEVVAFTCDT